MCGDYIAVHGRGRKFWRSKFIISEFFRKFVRNLFVVMSDRKKEEEFFKRMQQGDTRTFEYFFKEYTDLLYAYALGFVKKREPAEDIVQDVFVYFWNNRERIRYTGGVYAYLQRAVRNACINYREHEDVRNRYEQEMLYTEEEAFDWQEEESVREMRQKLLDALDRLPERCRQIFMMSCVDGLKYREIAAVLNVSENTVKTQVKLAYKKLREDINISREELSIFIVLLLL